eukprot:Sspe_Gene.90086::Locus_61711_Transcript_1_1_Confidence_1.000_Length_1357::g.90086::m.90086
MGCGASTVGDEKNGPEAVLFAGNVVHEWETTVKDSTKKVDGKVLGVISSTAEHTAIILGIGSLGAVFDISCKLQIWSASQTRGETTLVREVPLPGLPFTYAEFSKGAFAVATDTRRLIIISPSKSPITFSVDLDSPPVLDNCTPTDGLVKKAHLESLLQSNLEYNSCQGISSLSYYAATVSLDPPIQLAGTPNGLHVLSGRHCSVLDADGNLLKTIQDNLFTQAIIPSSGSPRLVGLQDGRVGVIAGTFADILPPSGDMTKVTHFDMVGGVNLNPIACTWGQNLVCTATDNRGGKVNCVVRFQEGFDHGIILFKNNPGRVFISIASPRPEILVTLSSIISRSSTTRSIIQAWDTMGVCCWSLKTGTVMTTVARCGAYLVTDYGISESGSPVLRFLQ